MSGKLTSLHRLHMLLAGLNNVRPGKQDLVYCSNIIFFETWKNPVPYVMRIKFVPIFQCIQNYATWNWKIK